MSQTPDHNPQGPQTAAPRRTPFSARGEPRVWLMAMAVIVCLLMIVGIVGLIVVRGSATFWPGPIDEVRLRDGSVFLGVPKQTETYTPQVDEVPQIEAARNAGTPMISGAFSTDDRPRRRRYFVGNRDLGQESYRWVSLWTVASVERPEDAIVVERLEWGPFIGRAQSLETQEQDGSVTVEALPAGDAGIDRLQSAVKEMQVRRAAIDEIDRVRVAGLVNDSRALDQRIREAQLSRDRAQHPHWGSPSRWVWWAGLAVFLLAAAGIWRTRTVRDRPPSGLARSTTRLVCVVVALGSGLYLWLERPGAHSGVSDARMAEIESRTDSERAEINAEQETLLERLAKLRTEDARYRARIVEPAQGRLSPSSRSTPDDLMLTSQIVRVVPGNKLGPGGRIAVYASRWWEFLSTNPREGAVAGGVFPVIVGTVTLTLLLTISVVPLGVIAALYLREYARQGLVTSIIRIAINNLAGVPSIVYGMFGLGFFCYTLGAYIDAGPKQPQPPGQWWGLVATLLLVVFLGGVLGLAARRSGGERRGSNRLLPIAGTVAWLAAAALAFWVIASTPYFGGFFAAKLPEQTTFGGRGVLWAALTLALLTLPVVIVATEEAIAAVPGSMREGSFGCGASKWQTIRSIILPAAMPGILTGAILAMARGAGEVAPLMLVGAVNLAPALPVSTEFPFLHGDRTFMHLGFHIYTLGFQSPDSEATQPLVWTTTLLLITIVLLLNLVAIIVRAKLRSRMKTSAV